MKASRILTPVLTVCLALTLAACGGPSTPSEPGEASSQPIGWDTNQMPRDQLVAGEFTGSISYPVSTWNQFSIVGNEQELVQLQAPIRPTYYDFDGLGEPVINTDYLLSAKTELEPNLVVTLELNPKAVWNDGSAVTANDWIATWKCQNGTDEKYAAAATDGWNQVTAVAAGVNSREVKLTFKSTYPDWTAIIADGPLPAVGAADPQTFNDGWTEYKDAFFSGPFRVTSWDQNSGTVIMEPNDKWWGAKPLLTKLTWKQVKSEALAAAFANQEVDYYDIGPDPAGYAQAKGAQNSTVRVAAGPDFRHFTFNSKSPILADVNLRQGIMMGLDRRVIAESDLAGLPGDKVPLNNNLYVAAQVGYVDQGKATGIDYNLDRARAKLDAAGWKLNGSTGYREKGGRRLDVTYAQLGGVKASENEGLQAQKMLKAIGVNLLLKTIDANKDWPGVLTDHAFDIISFSWAGTPYPLRNVGQIYGGSMNGGEWTPSESNFSQLRNPQLEALIPMIDTEMDAAKRAELGNQAAQSIWESVHTVPLYQRPMLIGVRSRLANIGALGMGRVLKWENVGYTK